jgi:UTP--glucose-1-phosphate uridylyltransferase
VVGKFDQHFAAGVPSMRKAEELVVEGDWTFGAGVRVVGRARLEGDGGRVEDGATLGG